MTLRVEQLNVRFFTPGGVVQAISDMSFTLGAGETLVIVGESGCGKTVLAHALMRLLPMNARVDGTVRLGDAELTALSETDMEQVRGRSIALIPQSAATALNPVLTIEAQLYDIARARGVDWPTTEAELEHILASLGLTFADVRRKYPHQLSGGMQQRIVNAAAMLGTPALVIADEPTYGMDPELVDTTAAMLKQIPQRGAALLVITHDLQFARKLSGRIGLMYGSYIVELREADEFFAGPLHPYGRGLLGALPENGLNEIPGHPPELTALRDECPFAPRCAHVKAACRAAVPAMQSVRKMPVAVNGRAKSAMSNSDGGDDGRAKGALKNGDNGGVGQQNGADEVQREMVRCVLYA